MVEPMLWLIDEAVEEVFTVKLVVVDGEVELVEVAFSVVLDAVVDDATLLELFDDTVLAGEEPTCVLLMSGVV